MVIIRILLLPLSFLYGIGVGIRNFLFNTGLLKSVSFDIPIICVGNISVGGTGKTPHTEWLLAELSKQFRTACLSRGYKRRTSGFILADQNSTAADIGDEPMQIKSKFPNVIVACDGNRVRGIRNLLALPERPDVIVLDDAFQHRYVKADKYIVLIDYNYPIHRDKLLPAGRLRESKNALKRADHIIVSKCPEKLVPIERRIITKQLRIKPYQKLFFTTMQYGAVQSLVKGIQIPVIHAKTTILCIIGIAHPETYISHLKESTEDILELGYADHHAFTPKDIRHIEASFDSIHNKEKYIFTTEKDVVRLKLCNIREDIKSLIFYIPIVPVFLNKKESLIEELTSYVTKNKR